MYELRNIFELKLAGDCPIKPRGSYWSGNTARQGRVGFWDVYPLCGGDEYVFVKQRRGFVRAVRP